ncbi:hypothetical protein NDU88_001431 [Pleurodeles waltl]|uniref:Uncharacterized protein n=1 Tax=Pleurodeles waltl TaxID=8319 RepID=A0AAV7M341_PLEWA|nr:hypothetical protein NDU88_001431 [Pleurodeles waltl]
MRADGEAEADRARWVLHSRSALGGQVTYLLSDLALQRRSEIHAPAHVWTGRVQAALPRQAGSASLLQPGALRAAHVNRPLILRLAGKSVCFRPRLGRCSGGTVRGGTPAEPLTAELQAPLPAEARRPGSTPAPDTLDTALETSLLLPAPPVLRAAPVPALPPTPPPEQPGRPLLRSPPLSKS